MQTGTFDQIADGSPMDGVEDSTAEQQQLSSKEVKSEPLVDEEVAPSEVADDTMEDAIPSKKISRDRDEDEGSDRPPKRAKTADASDANSTLDSSTTDLSGRMTKAREKFVLTIIRSLRRTKDARPFSMPVDAVKLNVPHYYDIITKPMDLQTMERKLNSSEYTDMSTFVDDFKQILENCATFNGADHAVTQMSRSMEATLSNCTGWPFSSKLSLESKIGSR